MQSLCKKSAFRCRSEGYGDCNYALAKRYLLKPHYFPQPGDLLMVSYIYLLVIRDLTSRGRIAYIEGHLSSNAHVRGIHVY